MALKCQQSVNADLKRNVFRCRLNCSVFELNKNFLNLDFKTLGDGELRMLDCDCKLSLDRLHGAV